MSLKRQTASGVKWLVSASLLEKLIQTATTVVLARLLEPADFGLFALAFVAMRSMNLFRSFGFDTALVQRKNDIEQAARSAFCLITLMGVVIFLVLNAIAPILARFFNNQALEPIIKVLGLIFVLTAISRVPAVLMEKDMRFNKLAVIDVITAVIFTVLAISFAVNHWGVLSLVYAYLLKVFCRTAMIVWAAQWKPRFEFHRKIAAEMLRFGKYRFAESIVGFFSTNTDRIVIGKFLGTTLLGYYTVAFNMAFILGKYVMSKIGRVLFPVFSKVQDDDRDLRRIYLKAISYFSLMSIPFATAVYLFSAEIIRIVYGDKWIAAIPILKILVIASALNILNAAGGPILLAKGKSKETFMLNLIETVVFLPAAVLLISLFKLQGAALALVVASAVKLVLNWIRISRTIQLDIRRVIPKMKLAALCSLAMIAVTALIRILPFMPPVMGIKQIFPFATQIVIAAASFLGTMIVLDKAMVIEIKQMLFSK